MLNVLTDKHQQCLQLKTNNGQNNDIFVFIVLFTMLIWLIDYDQNLACFELLYWGHFIIIQQQIWEYDV